MKRLTKVQEMHASKLKRALLTDRLGLDCSETGTGKTVTALAVAKDIIKSGGVGEAIVIAPKSLLSQWKAEITEAGLTENIKLHGSEKVSRTGIPRIINRKEKHWIWDENSKWQYGRLFIFDECDRAMGEKSKLGEVVRKLYFGANTQYILMLSATLFTEPRRLFTIGACMKKWKNSTEFYKQLGKLGYRMVKKWGTTIYSWQVRKDEAKEVMTGMRTKVYGDITSSMKLAERYSTLDIREEIWYREEGDPMGDTVQSEEWTGREPYIMEMLEVNEERKQRWIVNKVPSLIDEGYSVLVCLHFIRNIKELGIKLKSYYPLVYTGDTKDNIASFGKEGKNLLLMSAGAGAHGLNLHDEHGNSPRASIVSTSTFNGNLITQALGRINRAGQKSKSLQYILHSENGLERAADTIMKKREVLI